MERFMQFLELRVPPVIQIMIISAGMWLLASVFPALKMSLPGLPGLAFSVATVGLIIALLGIIEFRKVSTTVDPRSPEKSSQLVMSGIYRVSRNPMYVGFFLVLLGWAFFLMHYLAFLLLPLFVGYINRFQIQPEERFMAQRFGQVFNAYALKVRRWV